MRIVVSVQSLARQIPLLRFDILSIFEDDFILEGDEYNSSTHKHKDVAKNHPDVSYKDLYPIVRDYPEFEGVFSAMEMNLLDSIKHRELTCEGIASKLYGDGSDYKQNNVHVHMKNINKKLDALGDMTNAVIVKRGTKPRFYMLKRAVDK